MQIALALPPKLFARIGCALVKSEFSTKPDGRGLTELDLKRDIKSKQLLRQTEETYLTRVLSGG